MARGTRCCTWLYTSGSNRKPKGDLDTPTGGYLTGVSSGTHSVYGVRPASRAGGTLLCVVWMAAADCWLVGHPATQHSSTGGRCAQRRHLRSCNEGRPDYPHKGILVGARFERHKATKFYTAPTAIARLHLKWGRGAPGRKFDLSSLSLLGPGRRSDSTRKAWLLVTTRLIGGRRAGPIVDTWMADRKRAGILIHAAARHHARPKPSFGATQPLPRDQGRGRR